MPLDLLIRTTNITDEFMYANTFNSSSRRSRGGTARTRPDVHQKNMAEPLCTGQRACAQALARSVKVRRHSTFWKHRSRYLNSPAPGRPRAVSCVSVGDRVPGFESHPNLVVGGLSRRTGRLIDSWRRPLERRPQRWWLTGPVVGHQAEFDSSICERIDIWRPDPARFRQSPSHQVGQLNPNHVLALFAFSLSRTGIRQTARMPSQLWGAPTLVSYNDSA